MSYALSLLNEIVVLNSEISTSHDVGHRKNKVLKYAEIKIRFPRQNGTPNFSMGVSFQSI